VRDALFGQAVKTLPRTWFISVTVLSLPEREANSAASFRIRGAAALACVVDAERGVAFLAEHAAGAAVGGLTKTLVAVGIERV